MARGGRGPFHLHQMRCPGHPAGNARCGRRGGRGRRPKIRFRKARGGQHIVMSVIPNFAEIPLLADKPPTSDAKRAPALSGDERLIWQTPEQIPVRALYTASDLEGLDHLDTMPGIPPFIRGPYATMYVQRPWTVRQYAGF